MRRRSRNSILIVALVIVAIVGAGYLTLGRIPGDSYRTVLLSNVVNSRVTIQGVNEIAPGEEFDMDIVDHYDLHFEMTALENDWIFPVSTEFTFVCGNTILATGHVSDLLHVGNVYEYVVSVGAVPLGRNLCYFNVHAEWSQAMADGTYLIYNLEGQSYSFYLVSSDVAESPLIPCSTSDFFHRARNFRTFLSSLNTSANGADFAGLAKEVLLQGGTY
jgi:hypothetical protein